MNPHLPESLLETLKGVKGFDREAFKEIHTSGEQVTSVRINPFKWKEDLHTTGLPVQEKIPWTSHGYYLSRRPSFTFDPLFHAGVYYVQEASSTFLEQALRQTVDLTVPLRILDLCAAPGGKSTHILSLISPESLLVSNEVIRSRVNILYENVVKWGNANCIVTCNDPAVFSRVEDYFDVMVVDAPCSGSGLFRREPESAAAWRPDQVTLCKYRQQRILADAWPSLKRDGMLIYSTCSYSAEENEGIVDWMMENRKVETVPLSVEGSWNILETKSPLNGGIGYRFYPYLTKGEGFFMACLQKKEGGSFSRYPASKKKSIEKLPGKEVLSLEGFTSKNQELAYFKLAGMVHALPVRFTKDVDLLQSDFYLKKAGILMGKMAGHDLIPDPELALSTLLNQAVQRIATDEQTALEYLRKEEFHLADGLRGWVLVTYKEKPLGWIKVMPGRINNYYPKEWRILKKSP